MPAAFCPRTPLSPVPGGVAVPKKPVPEKLFREVKARFLLPFVLLIRCSEEGNVVSQRLFKDQRVADPKLSLPHSHYLSRTVTACPRPWF